MLGSGSHREKSIRGLVVDERKDGPAQRKEKASVFQLKKERYTNKDPKGGCQVAVQLVELLFAGQKPAN